ncbi:MAG: aspartate-semialdehyde dehydrogenase [Alphaproteobacteria bacterium]|nr:aspartate-semialdehyde dehydrogenase [Alphaproteobacteria bacterium]
MKKIAIIGVMNSKGRELLNMLEENGISADDVFAVDTDCPLGTQISYGEDVDMDVYNLRDFDFGSADVAVFATSEEISKHYVPRAAAKKTFVIDCSTAYTADSEVPLIVAGLNDEKLAAAPRGVVALPSPQVAQLLLPLKDVAEKYEITRLVINTYMSVSLYGKEAMDELFNQTRKIFMNEPIVDDEDVFHKQIAFNVLPQVGEFIGDETKYEWAMNVEIKKLLGKNIKVHANCAFVPSFIGIGAFVNVECNKDVDVDDVRRIMRDTKGIVVFDKRTDLGYVSLNDVQGESDIYISRLRQDISVKNGFSFWCAADDLRAGSAQNAYNVLQLIMNKKVN